MSTSEKQPLLAGGDGANTGEALPSAPPLDEPPPYEEPVTPGKSVCIDPLTTVWNYYSGF